MAKGRKRRRGRTRHLRRLYRSFARTRKVAAELRRLEANHEQLVAKNARLLEAWGDACARCRDLELDVASSKERADRAEAELQIMHTYADAADRALAAKEEARKQLQAKLDKYKAAEALSVAELERDTLRTTPSRQAKVGWFNRVRRLLVGGAV